jgi:hypothetical protein
MATTGLAHLPHSAKIRIVKGEPHPHGEVEVAPDFGRVHFQNEDDKEYLLRFWHPTGDEKTGIDVVLHSLATITIAIKKDDEFLYSVISIGISGDRVATGPGGPIRN